MTANLKAHDPSIVDERAQHSVDSNPGARRAALAGLVGAVVEWYDFFLYGTAAATVFSPLFFPSSDPATGLLAAFSTFAIGFLFRPIGGAVFGHFGDKLGRRSMLVLTVLIMGITSTLIGVLPTYHSAGVWAPIMLVALRAVQGFAVGGEWGGAALMAVESAPKKRRNFLSAGVQTGSFVGLLIGTAVFFLCQKLTTHDQFMAWGWRIPFLLSVLLAFVALWIRRSVPESAEFRELKKQHSEAGTPLGIVLRTSPLQILAVIGMRLLDQSTYYLAFTFSLAYVTNYTQVPPGNVMIASMISMALAMVTLPIFAKLADRFGIRWFYAIGSVVGASAAIPFFYAVHSGSIALMILGFFALINICHNMSTAIQPVWFAGLFDTKVRYSGAGFGYALAGAAGGFMPLIATALVSRAHGSYMPIALLLAGFCLVGGLTSLWSYRWVNLRT
ncbi:MFS transporter [Burkholderia sp. SR8]|uniref:MFS transporter n=1 Tax=Burkholderia sp. SR8 TaxID=3062277 RepID=UPI0040639A36